MKGQRPTLVGPKLHLKTGRAKHQGGAVGLFTQMLSFHTYSTRVYNAHLQHHPGSLVTSTQLWGASPTYDAQWVNGNHLVVEPREGLLMSIYVYIGMYGMVYLYMYVYIYMYIGHIKFSVHPYCDINEWWYQTLHT